MLLSALDVARAALLEVGREPSLVSLQDGELIMWEFGAGDAYKACLIAEMSVYGPNYMTRCPDCLRHSGWEATKKQTCTPVRDVLQGVRCGSNPS